MKRIVIVTFISVFLLFISAGSALACTMVMVTKGDVILAGNNEDWKEPDTKMWIYPAAKDKYGRVCFGFGSGYTQGGMNDLGLFIDGNALSPTGWKSDPGKPTFRGNLLDHILEHCATVDEAYVIDLNKELKKGKKTYDIPSLFLVKTQAARLFERLTSKPGSEAR